MEFEKYCIFATVLHLPKLLKNKTLHIALSCLLLANLLFTHVASNFLHNHATENGHSHRRGEASYPTIDIVRDNCAVCDLHLFVDLYYVNITLSQFINRIELGVLQFIISFIKNATIFSVGRAPPLVRCWPTVIILHLLVQKTN